jgi:hypothetical protein
MIGTRTTFIVGAGGSRDYGLPLGRKLFTDAQAMVTPGTDVYQLLNQAGLSLSALSAFEEHIQENDAPSLDNFLETKQLAELTYVMAVGRAVIAVLLGRDLTRITGPWKNDWIGNLVQRMRSGAATPRAFIEENRVRFVTFNYDLLIEQRLTQVLQIAYYGHPAADIQAAVDAFPVVHVHGILPPLPATPFGAKNLEAFSSDWLAWIAQAQSEIYVVFDDIPKATLDRAVAAVEEAQSLCFLGFGYDGSNLDKLDPAKTLAKSGHKKAIYGSAVGLPPGHRAVLVNRLQGITFGQPAEGCLEMLDQCPIF